MMSPVVASSARRTVQRYHVSFPATDPHDPHPLGQDEAYFTLSDNDGNTSRIRFHDYDRLYQFPGLYEQLFYDRLKCASPEKVVTILKDALLAEPATFNQLRVLDFGAGNGMVGEELRRHGVARIVGCDILPAARDAALRDRPGVYDEYYDFDLDTPAPEHLETLGGWSFNCLISVAALGFGDIPVGAFRRAFNLIEDGGWVAFNIKETFLDNDDVSGFSVFIKKLLLTGYLDLHHLERYRHRLSIDGRPLYYFGIAGRKVASAPMTLVTPSP